MIRRLIVNADDFGFTDGHNLGIEQAHLHGILNRASLLSNGWAFDQAVEIAKRHAGLGVGVHLTLNEGTPLISPSRLVDLVNSEGEFYDDLKTLAMRWLHGQLKESVVYPEWQAQVERAIQHGIFPTHLDSHKHIHLFPPLLNVILKLAHEHQVAYVRLPLSLDALRRGPLGAIFWMLALRARRYLLASGIPFADHFIGVGDTGMMDTKRLHAALQRLPPGTTEIMVHPARTGSAQFAAFQRRFAWGYSFHFEEELHALCAARSANLLG